MTSLTPARREQIDAALDRRDIAAAARIAEKACADGVLDPLVLNLAAWLREEEADYPAALHLLGQALELAPGDPLILGAIGAVLRKQGHLRDALLTLDEAIAAEPRVASFWLERAMALEAGGSLAPALESYSRAASLDPQSASAFGGAASIAARQGDTERALDAGTRALALDPREPLAAAALARLDLDGKNPEAALKRLALLLNDLPTDESNQSIIWNLAGDALDRVGQPDEAFAAYSRSNQASARRFARVLEAAGGTVDHRAWAERLLREFEAIDPSAWRAEDGPAHDEGRRLAFLIGYPRSGTTLVETIVATASGVDSLEERPTLAAGDHFVKEEGGLRVLAGLGQDEIADLRGAYWDTATAAGADPAARLLVDMDPLKGLKLPLIAKLFPEARVVVLRRDPRDVVWSCFRSNFAPSPAALQHTDLERAARHYAAVMEAQDRFLETLPLRAFELRYEELVRDFDAVTRSLCAFLGIDWTPELREFAATAARRPISTVSVTQVRKGLYDGSQQWRRYEKMMKPVLPILQRWVERYGYSDI